MKKPFTPSGLAPPKDLKSKCPDDYFLLEYELGSFRLVFADKSSYSFSTIFPEEYQWFYNYLVRQFDGREEFVDDMLSTARNFRQAFVQTKLLYVQNLV